jgi:hypothetical protein
VALSAGAASGIATGVDVVASYFLSRSTAKAQKKVAAAQAKLIALQSEEQRIRNRILAQSYDAQDQRLPFEVSSPSSPGYGVGLEPEGQASREGGTMAAGFGSVGALVALGALFFVLLRS